MKFIQPILLICALTIVLISCERDDICAEGTATTPHLVIRLYDVSNPESTKNAFNFRAQGVGNDNPLTSYDRVTTDSIVIPLKTFENQTQFKLHKDYAIDDNGTPDDTSDDFVIGNEDIVTITYLAEEIYVSRACGYKTIFNDMQFSVQTDADNWIIDFENLNTTVDNEIEAHVKIYH